MPPPCIPPAMPPLNPPCIPPPNPPPCIPPPIPPPCPPPPPMPPPPPRPNAGEATPSAVARAHATRQLRTLLFIPIPPRSNERDDFRRNEKTRSRAKGSNVFK